MLPTEVNDLINSKTIDLSKAINVAFVPKSQKNRDGRCYELAGRFIMANPDWDLVHATLYPYTGKFKDRAFPHAFAEHGPWVYDPVFNKFYVKLHYYHFYRVTAAKTYTSDEACKMMLKTKHFGDW